MSKHTAKLSYRKYPNLIKEEIFRLTSADSRCWPIINRIATMHRTWCHKNALPLIFMAHSSLPPNLHHNVQENKRVFILTNQILSLHTQEARVSKDSENSRTRCLQLSDKMFKFSFSNNMNNLQMYIGGKKNTCLTVFVSHYETQTITQQLN